MKVGKWDMLPLSPRKRKGAKDRVKVDTMVAIQQGKRVLVHRVEKRKDDGTAEVFIIKASPSDLEIDH
jgi:hypothetical protein